MVVVCATVRVLACLLSVLQAFSVMPPKRNAANADGLGEDARAIIDAMKLQFDEMKIEMTNLNNLLANKCQEIDSLTADVALLRKKIAKLENSLDNEDAYVRRGTIIFNGTAIPPATTGEICNNVIRTVIKDILKISLQPSDISVAHRAGKKLASQGQDRRGIQVRFCRRDIKREIMLTKRENSDGNSTIFTNESLTLKRHTLLFALRQKRRNFLE